ncbi:TPA: hypothetical protein R1915_002280 [Staphylococcus delphini]|nr:hypothetical protein [Staphylococcus delphini]
MKELFTAFRSDKTSIKSKGSWLFYGLTAFVVLASLLLLFGHFYTEDEVTNANTEVGRWNDLSASGKVKIDKWEWNKTNHTMDLVLQYHDDINQSKDINRSYEMIPNTTPNQTVEYKVIAETDNKQAIRIYGVRKGFEVMVVKVFQNSGSESGKGEEITKLLGNENKVKINSSFKDMSKEDYHLEFVQNDIDDTLNSIKTLEKYKEKAEKKISKTESEINKLESEKSYQTGIEKTETDSKIESKKTDIDSYNTEIQDTDNEIKQAKEKVELLKQKYKDIQKYT